MSCRHGNLSRHILKTPMLMRELRESCIVWSKWLLWSCVPLLFNHWVLGQWLHYWVILSITEHHCNVAEHGVKSHSLVAVTLLMKARPGKPRSSCHRSRSVWTGSSTSRASPPSLQGREWLESLLSISKVHGRIVLTSTGAHFVYNYPFHTDIINVSHNYIAVLTIITDIESLGCSNIF